MATYIDLHCHILPAVDDGPSSLEDSLTLARSLVQHGYTTAVATPHYLEDYSPDYRRAVEEQYNLLCQALKDTEIPLTLHLGGELLLTPVLAKLAAEGTLPTLNGTSYVLLELPLFQPLPLYTRDVFFELQARGYKPILAHPERVEAIKVDISFIYNLIKDGNYIQLNLGSLGGRYGRTAKKLAQEMLKYNLVHFIGSDSHDTSVLNLTERELAAPKYLATFLKDNPEKVLKDTSILSAPCKPKNDLRKRIRKIFK